MFLTGDNAGDVFLELVVVSRLDEVLPAFNGEHGLNVNLCIGVCHGRKMPLLTELENPFWLVATKMSHLRCCDYPSNQRLISAHQINSIVLSNDVERLQPKNLIPIALALLVPIEGNR